MKTKLQVQTQDLAPQPVKLILILAFTLSILSCKQESSVNIDYQFSDKPTAIACKTADSLLLKEALYAFESDISNFYDSQRQSIAKAYSSFIRNASNNRINVEQIATPHTVEVFKALKEKSELWDNGHLNYSSELVNCLSENFQDESLKTTYNALQNTNSLTPKLFGAPLVRKYSQALRDKNLATYIALDYYYAQFFTADLTKVGEKPAQANQSQQRPVKKPALEVSKDQKVDFNKLPRKK